MSGRRGHALTGSDSVEGSDKVIEIATAMLDETMDLVAGCRRLCSLRHDLDARYDELFDPIVGFESQTDHHPVGDLRALYSQDYLRQLDRELAEYLDVATPEVLAACKRIIEALQLGS